MSAPVAPPGDVSGGLAGDPVIRRRAERLAGVVQAVGGNRPPDVARHRWETLAIFAFFGVAYTWFGYWLVVHQHVVGFEALDRLNRTLMMWHNDPPKLAAIGFDYPPLATLLVSPLTVVPALGRSLAIVPVASALCAGVTMVALNAMLRRGLVVTPLRYAVLLAVGLNPLFVLYAAGGSRHLMWIALVVVAVGALFAWYVTADIRFVMVSGLTFSVAALTGYSSLLWCAIAALMIGSVLTRLGARSDEVEGTTVGFAAPTAYVLALWMVLNVLMLANPVAWIVEGRGTGGPDLGLAELAEQTARLVIAGAPLALVVLPALVFVGMRNNGFALWLAVMLLGAVLAPAASSLLGLSEAPMLMRNALPILLLSVIGAIWVARSVEERNSLVVAVLVALLVASVPWTFHAMRTYPFQNLEAAFADAVSTGESQEGARTLAGGTVGVASEQAMADYIRANIATSGSILTDNAQTYGVMLLTGEPALFLDRVDRSDGPWREAATDPTGYDVRYLLLSTTEGDLLSELYPDAVEGTDARLPELFSTPRYVLVGVPEGFVWDPADDPGTPAAAAPGGAR